MKIRFLLKCCVSELAKSFTTKHPKQLISACKELTSETTACPTQRIQQNTEIFHYDNEVKELDKGH